MFTTFSFAREENILKFLIIIYNVAFFYCLSTQCLKTFTFASNVHLQVKNKHLIDT